MRIHSVSAAYAPQSTAQLTVAADGPEILELSPGERLDGEVLRMVDRQAVIQVGDKVITMRSNVPLVPGAISLQVEAQVDGEWHLRMLENEPALFLVQEQLADLRLSSDSSREMLMRALLGQVVIDRDTFLQAELLWKGVERQPQWLPALVELLKSGGELSEANLQAMKQSLEQSKAPGWLHAKANDTALQLLRQWGMEANPERMQLLSALLEAVPDFAETEFTAQRWLADVAQLQQAGEGTAANERMLPQVLLPSSEAPDNAPVQVQTEGQTQQAEALLSDSATAILQRDSAGSGAVSVQPEGATQHTAGMNQPEALRGASSPLESFQLLEQLWNDAGRPPELLPQLVRIFYSDQPKTGQELVKRLAEQESAGRFARLQFSEAEMGDKRALLQRIGLSERPERLVVLQSLYKENHRINREQLLQAESLWRQAGGKPQFADGAARTVLQSLPQQVSTLWALQQVQDQRIQAPVVYMWLNLAQAEPIWETHFIQPDLQGDADASPTPETNEPQPLLMIGFQSQHLGPSLLSVTPQRGQGYSLRLTVDDIWKREIEKEAVRELLPRLRQILPQLHWQVEGIREKQPAESPEPVASPQSKKRFDYRI